MLTIKTYISKSKIPEAGLGLFCGESVERGDIVWKNTKYSEIIYSEVEWDKLPSEFKDNVSIYVYKCKGYYHLNLDNSRHMNHSTNPSVIEDDNGNNVASFELSVGDEITCDYTKFYDGDWFGMTIK